ncbi:MAG: hypothetical protein ACOX18_07735 [Bacillota bacterium]
MQLTYTLKNTQEAQQGEFDPESKILTLASGRQLNLGREDDLKLAKKLIYSKVVTMPELKAVTLSSLLKM